MATVVDVLDSTGNKTGTRELPEEIFNAPINVALIHQVVVAQQAAARQGTHKVKTRGEVRGGGRKPWRQKGTGRARHGSIRSPQWTGGGVVHGPTTARNYNQRTPKKMRAAALRAALSERAQGGCVRVIDGFGLDGVPSTRTAAKLLDTFAANRTVLAVITRDDDLGWKSLRNLTHVHVIHPDQLNTYDVLASNEIVFTVGALEQFLADRTGGGNANDANEQQE